MNTMIQVYSTKQSILATILKGKSTQKQLIKQIKYHMLYNKKIMKQFLKLTICIWAVKHRLLLSGITRTYKMHLSTDSLMIKPTFGILKENEIVQCCKALCKLDSPWNSTESSVHIQTNL